MAFNPLNTGLLFTVLVFFLNYSNAKHPLISLLASAVINGYIYFYYSIPDLLMNSGCSLRETSSFYFHFHYDSLLLIAWINSGNLQHHFFLPRGYFLFQRFQTTSLGIRLFVDRKISCLQTEKRYTNHCATSPCTPDSIIRTK